MLNLTIDKINKAHNNINDILDEALIKLLKTNKDKSIVEILEYIDDIHEYNEKIRNKAIEFLKDKDSIKTLQEAVYHFTQKLDELPEEEKEKIKKELKIYTLIPILNYEHGDRLRAEDELTLDDLISKTIEIHQKKPKETDVIEPIRYDER